MRGVMPQGFTTWSPDCEFLAFILGSQLEGFGMFKTRFAVALILAGYALASNAACTARDKWTGDDKTLHLGAGFMAGAGATAYFGGDTLKGIAVGAAIGAAKEWSDSKGAGTCSLQDLMVTVAGAALGAYTAKWGLGVTPEGRPMVTYRTTF